MLICSTISTAVFDSKTNNYITILVAYVWRVWYVCIYNVHFCHIWCLTSKWPLCYIHVCMCVCVCVYVYIYIYIYIYIYNYFLFIYLMYMFNILAPISIWIFWTDVCENYSLTKSSSTFERNNNALRYLCRLQITGKKISLSLTWYNMILEMIVIGKVYQSVVPWISIHARSHVWGYYLLCCKGWKYGRNMLPCIPFIWNFYFSFFPYV